MRSLTFCLVALSLVACKHDNGGNADQGVGDDAGATDDLGDVDLAGGGFITVDGGLNACATDTQKGTLKPLDIYLMVDSSGSMSELTGGTATPSKWSAVGTAINDFVNDPLSAGIGVGLQFFPITKAGTTAKTCATDADCGAEAPCIDNKACGQSGAVKFCSSNADCPTNVSCVPVGVCQNNTAYACFGGGPGCGKCLYGALSYCSGRDSCTAGDYQTPAVAIAPLPGAASAISAALSGHMPDGLTPTAPALKGAVDQASAYAAANADHVVVTVLATDGFPTECSPQDIPGIAAIAAGGVAATPSIKTFVIGVFNTSEQMQATTNLNQIAAAGGSGSAFIISTAGNVTTAFLMALNQIRGSSLPCEYKLPVPASGVPDYGQVNVQFTSGGMTKIVPGAGSQSACDPTLGGWYYDVDPNAGTPTQVILCPKSCDVVKADTAGQIDIVQGCATIVL